MSVEVARPSCYKRETDLGRATLLAALTVATFVSGALFGQDSETGRMVRGSGAATFRVADAALLLGGRSGGGIAVRLATSPTPSVDGRYQVLVATEIDLRPILTAVDSHTVELETFVYALDRDSNVVARSSERSVFDIDPNEIDSISRALKVLQPIQLSAGEFRLRSLVRQLGSERFGLASARLSLPDPAAVVPTLSSPWWVAPQFSWTVVTPAEGLADGIGALYSFDSAGRLLGLSAQPTAAAGTRLVGSVLSLQGDLAAEGLQGELLRADGQPITGVSIETVARLATPRPEISRLVFELTIPDLPPAQYRFTLGRGTPAGGGIQARTAIPFDLVEPEQVDSVIAWTELESTAPESVQVDDTRDEETDIRDLERKVVVEEPEILATYRSVIELLARGFRLRARGILREFEIGAVSGKSPAAISDLGRSEIRALASIEAEATAFRLPIALVYAELVGDYHRRGLAPLSEHALRMSTELTEPITRRSRGGLEETVAADVLVSIASYAILASRSGVGEQLLESALRIEPRHEAALMSLAALREQHGRYDEALLILEKLSEAHPENREARLRLAINLRRTKAVNRAEELFRQLIAEGRRDWIELVAIDELASLTIESARLDEAQAILRAAIADWPDAPSLKIHLAWLLDQSQHLDAAGRMIEKLLATAGSNAPSPRYRYNQWHGYVFDESRQTLSRLVQDYVTRAGDKGPEIEGSGES